MASGKGSVHASRKIRMGKKGDVTLVGAARPSSLHMCGEQATAQERSLKPEPQVRNVITRNPLSPWTWRLPSKSVFIAIVTIVPSE